MNQRDRVSKALASLLILAVTAFGLASILATQHPTEASVPASQIWVISWMPDCSLGTCGTNVNILKGGAISQREPATKVVSSDGRCSYPAPVSGNLSGRIFTISVTAGGCGETVQGFSQGDANGEYGTATSARGTITWRFRPAASITQTWSATLLR